MHSNIYSMSLKRNTYAPSWTSRSHCSWQAHLQTAAQYLISIQAPVYKPFHQSSQASQIYLEREMWVLAGKDFLIGIWRTLSLLVFYISKSYHQIATDDKVIEFQLNPPRSVNLLFWFFSLLFLWKGKAEKTHQNTLMKIVNSHPKWITFNWQIGTNWSVDMFFPIVLCGASGSLTNISP